MKRKVTSLQPGEHVVFRVYNDIYKGKRPIDGTVDFINTDKRLVSVSYLYGYNNMDAFIPYEDMLAVYNPNGDYMRFSGVEGLSDELIPE
jgi:hypothetical protein